MTVRKIIENFAYPNIEYFSEIMDTSDNEKEFLGVKIKGDNERLTIGAMLETSVYLYLHYLKIKSNKANLILGRIKRFVKTASALPLDTWSWGCYYVLRAFLLLKKNNLLCELEKEDVEKIKKLTEYTHFYDKENRCTKNGLPSNYIQVCMAIASFREQLGWEKDKYSEEIKKHLLSVMSGSSSGWMDEQPPHGRFDRYSILVPSEACDNMMSMETDIPQSLKSNLKDAFDMMLFMKNNEGHGINYGRSLSCHGDCGAMEVISSALALNIVDEKDIDDCVLYCIKILEKTINFWYSKERKSFNIWWDGRSTNAYRQSHRVLEVNVDMLNHLLSTLHNFEIANLADYEPKKTQFEEPQNWQCYCVKFIDEKDKKSETFVLKRKKTMAMLPLIGLGTVHHNMAYMPYPSICGKVEGSPEGHEPFLIPQLKTESGEILRPIQFFNDILCEESDGKIIITAVGKLAEVSGKVPAETDFDFRTVYTFDGDKITVEFKIDCDFKECEMYVGTHSNQRCIDAFGFDFSSKIENSERIYDFMTPHGPLCEVTVFKTVKNRNIGYIINL